MTGLLPVASKPVDERLMVRIGLENKGAGVRIEGYGKLAQKEIVASAKRKIRIKES